MVEITNEKFKRYVDVQKSGITNMFDVPYVMELSGLTREEILDIMSNYSTYKDKFGL